MEWLNSYGRHRQYTYEISAKAQKLLDRYGWFFDDEWAYYQRPKSKLKGIMLRVPVWLWPETGTGRFNEKWRRHSHEKQTRLPVKVKRKTALTN